MKINVAFKDNQIKAEILTFTGKPYHTNIVNFLDDYYGDGHWFVYKILNENNLKRNASEADEV